SPSSRLFCNPLYIDIEAVEEFREDAATRARVGGEEFQKRLQALRATDQVAYVDVAAAKTSVLQGLYRYFRERHLVDDADPRGRAFREFQRERGPTLRRFAIFLALSEQMVARGLHTWHEWPADYRDCVPDALAAFESANLEAVGFHEYLQWLAHQ